MPIEFTILKKADIEGNEIFLKVSDLAEKLRKFLNKPEVQKSIRQCHVFGAKSTEIQEIILQKATALGFQNEKNGLFQDYLTSQLRPDYFCVIDNTGILLEVERGKTITNNMDLVDMWKCHICRHAKYLFLVVPQERHSENGRTQKHFKSVSKRLAAFYEHDNYINVDAVFLYGY